MRARVPGSRSAALVLALVAITVNLASTGAGDVEEAAAGSLSTVVLPPVAGVSGDRVRSADLPAKLRINRARLRGGRLMVRGSLAAPAAGEPITLRLRAADGGLRMRTRVGPDGRFAVTRMLRGSERRFRANRIAIRFAGNDTLRPAFERLRIGRRPVDLRIVRVRARGGRIALAGRVSSGTRGWARIGLGFRRLGGDPAQTTTRVRVGRRGRFSAEIDAPPAVRRFGAWVSVSHPGGRPAFGQRRGRALAATQDPVLGGLANCTLTIYNDTGIDLFSDGAVPVPPNGTGVARSWSSSGGSITGGYCENSFNYSDNTSDGELVAAVQSQIKDPVYGDNSYYCNTQGTIRCFGPRQGSKLTGYHLDVIYYVCIPGAWPANPNYCRS